MTLTGKNLINGTWVSSDQTFTQEEGGDLAVAETTEAQVAEACSVARSAFRAYTGTSRSARAAFLRRIADEIEALGAEITAVAMGETGLPEARLNGERGRTTGQLKMFADLIEDKAYLDVRHDEALPDRAPLPRPDLRLTHKAIGPVAVFGASNFPLAFSTAGGDTASALAAGCPVVVKGHQAHPGTTELVAQAIHKAITACDMPTGTFQLLQGAGIAVGSALVQNPEITAVGFTGSLRGGRALYDLCHARPVPIPFYGELGSINPMFCLPNAVESRGEEIGSGWAGSLTMGAGQFCTNPGIAIVIGGDAADKLEAACVSALKDSQSQKMLSGGIEAAYKKGVESFGKSLQELVNCGTADKPLHALPALFRATAKEWLANEALQTEVFGAAGILVHCENETEMMELAEALEGQLTTTLHLDADDTTLAGDLLPVLEEKCGRILCNGFPTGVEVCSAMMHGGPYPASTDVRSTSVGTLAIARWLRPVSYQNMPVELLPNELK